MASARMFSRSIGSWGRSPLARAAYRSERCFASSCKALSTAGQFFSCSGVSFSPARSAAMRASPNAEISSALGRHRGPRWKSSEPCWAYTSVVPAIASAVVPARTAFHMATSNGDSRLPSRGAVFCLIKLKFGQRLPRRNLYVWAFSFRKNSLLKHAQHARQPERHFRDIGDQPEEHQQRDQPRQHGNRKFGHPHLGYARKRRTG